MAGYLGTKAVLLSTTAADVTGNAEIGGSLTVGGAFTSQGIDDNASATAMTLDAAGNVTVNSNGSVAALDGISGIQVGNNAAATSGLALETSNRGYLWYIGSGTSSLNLWDSTANSDRLTIDSAGNVGIGIAPSYPLHVNGTAAVTGSTYVGSALSAASPDYSFISDSGMGMFRLPNVLGFSTGGSEAMRIDSSGNLLVGKTSADNSAGATIKPDGEAYFVKSNNAALSLNRLSSDGVIQYFFKDTSLVGSIGKLSGNNEVYFSASGTSSNGILCSNGNSLIPLQNAALSDNTQDIGSGSYRWNDIFATNAAIQTSDRNEKQDIETLNAAETRVAVACKGLLRKFRWKDAVAEKGDDARIHFGIIAQDLQDAFAAEGLDAGRYAMFISSTWWETQTDVPAVEAVEAVYEDVTIPAVLDEDGNEVEPERVEQQLVTEAVEAKEAYTRTDTYETLEEAPEGATERTRLGVRYPELLAFIIGAM